MNKAVEKLFEKLTNKSNNDLASIKQGREAGEDLIFGIIEHMRDFTREDKQLVNELLTTAGILALLEYQEKRLKEGKN